MFIKKINESDFMFSGREKKKKGNFREFYMKKFPFTKIFIFILCISSLYNKNFN